MSTPLLFLTHGKVMAGFRPHCIQLLLPHGAITQRPIETLSDMSGIPTEAVKVKYALFGVAVVEYLLFGFVSM